MHRRILTLTLIFLALGLAACDDEDCQTCVPPDATPAPTLDNVWPNEDGREWTYDYAGVLWDDMTTAPMDSFSIDDVDSLLALGPGPEDVRADEAGVWRLQFDGTTTTDSGAEGQLLAGTFFDLEDEAMRREAEGRQDILRRLVSRDRTAGLDRRAYGPGSLFMSGDAAWVKTGEVIGGYGDLDTALSWKFLEADLAVGHTFTFQLVPSLADDVYLHAQIRSVGDVETPRGTFENVVTVNYLIDQGLQQVTDEVGQVLAQTRAYRVARMQYAPEIGPIHCIERGFVPFLDEQPGSGLVEDFVYDLIGTGLFTE